MLRLRLFLNLVPLVLALLVVGGYAIVLFSRLADEVDVTVRDNHRIAMAAQTMKGAVSGIRGSLNQSMRGADSATNEFLKHCRVFESNLSLQASNAHLFSESQLVEQLRISYHGLHAAGQDVLKLSQRREQRQVFEREVVPRALAMNLLLDRVGRITQKNILATSQSIQM